jgi:hypothetical protein
MNGGPSAFAVLNAPYAAGSMGGVNLHFDTADTTISGTAAATATASVIGSYNTLAFRTVPY